MKPINNRTTMNAPLPPKFRFKEIPWGSPIHPRHRKLQSSAALAAIQWRSENALGKAAPDLRSERLEPGEPK